MIPTVLATSPTTAPRWPPGLVAACLLAAAWLAAPALAAGADYARQWPITLGREDGGAYRVVLDETVYRQVQRADLGDLEVRDGQGRAVPTDVFAVDLPMARPAPRVELPWFPLPPTAGVGASKGWEMVSEADADGHLRRVEARIIDGAVAGLPRVGVLVDLSRVREAVVALEFDWQPTASLDLGYRVEASDDLEHWQPLATRGRLVDLQREGRRLLHRRIELYGLLPQYQRARYLRLIPDRSDQPLQLTAVHAQLAAATAAPALQWRMLHARRSAAVGTGAGAAFEFELDGRFPIEQVDVQLPGNHAVEWRLESRDRADADWRPRIAPWMAYRVEDGRRAAGAGGNRSDPVRLAAPLRDRYWRLSANGAVQGDPLLRLGYRPEVVVFLAEGRPPYALVAGSARARRAESPLSQLVAVLRRQHGADWQPAPAYLAASSVLAGASALSPARDWTTWLLWSVLALGAVVVGGFALSLLRRTPVPQGRG